MSSRWSPHYASIYFTHVSLAPNGKALRLPRFFLSSLLALHTSRESLSIRSKLPKSFLAGCLPVTCIGNHRRSFFPTLFTLACSPHIQIAFMLSDVDIIWSFFKSAHNKSNNGHNMTQKIAFDIHKLSMCDSYFTKIMQFCLYFFLRACCLSPLSILFIASCLFALCLACVRLTIGFPKIGMNLAFSGHFVYGLGAHAFEYCQW